MLTASLLAFPVGASDLDLAVILGALGVCAAWAGAIALVARKSPERRASRGPAPTGFVERRKSDRGFRGMSQA